MLLQDPREVNRAHKQMLLQDPREVDRAHKQMLLQDPKEVDGAHKIITNKCSYKTPERWTEHTK